MMPTKRTVTGTSGVSSPIFPDQFQNPFSVSIGCVLTAAGTFSVQHTFDYSTVMLPTWDGSTGVTWFTNSGITAATTSIASNYAFPVAAVRLSVLDGVATTSVTMFYAQATNAP